MSAHITKKVFFLCSMIDELQIYQSCSFAWNPVPKSSKHSILFYSLWAAIPVLSSPYHYDHFWSIVIVVGCFASAKSKVCNPNITVCSSYVETPEKKCTCSNPRKLATAWYRISESQLTTLMRKHGLAHRTGPHSQAARQLGLRMAGQVLPQGALVHVVLPTHRAGVVRRPPLGYIRINRFSLRWVRWCRWRTFDVTRIVEG